MNKEDVINEAKQHITTRFANMTFDEFEQLQAGDGTLSVVDEVLDMLPTVFRIINPEVKQIVEEFDENDIAELADYCCNRSDEVYEKYYTRFENFSDDHKRLLERMAESMMQRFAETVTAEQYDDIDEWIDFIQKFECFTFQELQYIDRLRTDEAKEKYRIQKD